MGSSSDFAPLQPVLVIPWSREEASVIQRPRQSSEQGGCQVRLTRLIGGMLLNQPT